MLQLIFAYSRSKPRPTTKGQSYFKKSQASPSLKHHCLAISHISPIVETPPFNNFLNFPIVETPLFSNFLHFPIAETPLFRNFPHFPPFLKHHCSTIFHISPIAETPPFSNFLHFPIAETPLFRNFSHLPHC
jgi:hypothetical protein